MDTDPGTKSFFFMQVLLRAQLTEILELSDMRAPPALTVPAQDPQGSPHPAQGPGPHVRGRQPLPHQHSGSPQPCPARPWAPPSRAYTQAPARPRPVPSSWRCPMPGAPVPLAPGGWDGPWLPGPFRNALKFKNISIWCTCSARRRIPS